MIAEITPGLLTQSVIDIPPSKSMAHRAVICAALAKGQSVIHHVDYSDDILTTIEGMRALGAGIETHGSDVMIEGISDFSGLRSSVIQCNESGSTLRFFIPIFSLTQKPVVFLGRNRLLKRPQTVYQELFSSQGLHYRQDETQIEIAGALKPGEFTVRGDISSQFISGLMLAMATQSIDSRIHIVPPFESRSYIDLTMQMMADFGVKTEYEDDLTILIPGGQSYQPRAITVESDYSQLGFYAALGSLNAPLCCRGVRSDSRQGDRRIVDFIRDLGGRAEIQENAVKFQPAALKGCTIDLEDCPDLGPVLMTIASFAEGETHFINAGRLRLKESDRIEAMEMELRKLGVKIHSSAGEVWVQGASGWKTSELLHGHRDHRIVMSLAVGATLAENPVQIAQAESIAKSYPGFFEDLRKLGIQVKEIQE